VTKLIQRMREELVRRNYAQTTIRSYLQTIEDFRRFAHKRLDHLGQDDIRKYQVHLLEERKLGVGTVAYHVAALRFFYVRTLKRPAMKEDLPYPNAPRHTRRLPTILTPEEVSRLIDSARNLFHYTMLLTMYSAGLRRSELCKLKVSNIDSGRMVIRIERGKGGVDREVPLNPKLLTTLREYWRWMRPKTYLFPGTRNGCCCSVTRILHTRRSICTFRKSTCRQRRIHSTMFRFRVPQNCNGRGGCINPNESPRRGGGRYPSRARGPLSGQESILAELSATDGAASHRPLPHGGLGRTSRFLFRMRSSGHLL